MQHTLKGQDDDNFIICLIYNQTSQILIFFLQLCLMALCLSSGSGIAIAKSQPEPKADSDAESDAEGQYSDGK